MWRQIDERMSESSNYSPQRQYLGKDQKEKEDKWIGKKSVMDVEKKKELNRMKRERRKQWEFCKISFNVKLFDNMCLKSIEYEALFTKTKVNN